MPPSGSVRLADTVYQACLAHALMTEREEVMGLLFGDVLEDEVHIWSSMTLRRNDKRPDRCEISEEMLSEGILRSEKLIEELGCTTRVVGWYHSHPHITCLPSHVDLRTQLQYQSMDQMFIGLIFAVFNSDARDGTMRHELMAFRADNSLGDGALQQVPVQVDVVQLCQLGWPGESERRAADSDAFGGALGQHAMVATARECFQEICELHSQQMEGLTRAAEGAEAGGPAYWAATAGHIHRLAAVASDELVPLSRFFEDAEHNARMMEAYRLQRAQRLRDAAAREAAAAAAPAAEGALGLGVARAEGPAAEPCEEVRVPDSAESPHSEDTPEDAPLGPLVPAPPAASDAPARWLAGGESLLKRQRPSALRSPAFPPHEVELTVAEPASGSRASPASRPAAPAAQRPPSVDTTRCRAEVKGGLQCKRHVKHPDVMCHSHQGWDCPRVDVHQAVDGKALATPRAATLSSSLRGARAASNKRDEMHDGPMGKLYREGDGNIIFALRKGDVEPEQFVIADFSNDFDAAATAAQSFLFDGKRAVSSASAASAAGAGGPGAAGATGAAAPAARRAAPEPRPGGAPGGEAAATAKRPRRA